MASAQFDIVFRGVREGFDATQVKGHFASLFKLEAEKTERIFKARKVTLKTNVEETLAHRYVARLAAIGVLADTIAIEPAYQKPPVVSRAIYSPDNGEESVDANPMHQPVDFLYGEHTRRIPFVFTGKEVGYLGVWLVNLLACLFSAGILYPWAKVRSLRYFYEHTYLDGIAFHYKSHPQKILLLQFALHAYLVALVVSFFFQPAYFVPGVIVFLIALPFYLYSCEFFHNNHSVYSQLCIRQESDLRKAYAAFLAWPLAIILTAGLIAPYAIYRIHLYLIQSKSIGDYSLRFSANLRQYLVLLPPLLIAHMVTGLCFYARNQLPLWLLASVVALVWLSLFIRWRVILVNRLWNGTCSKLGYFVASWDLASYNKLIIRNWCLCMLTLGLYWPWARIHSARYKAQHLAFFSNQRFQKWRRAQLIEKI